MHGAAGAFLPHRSQMSEGAHNDGTQRKAEARRDWRCARGCAILEKGPLPAHPNAVSGFYGDKKKIDTQFHLQMLLKKQCSNAKCNNND